MIAPHRKNRTKPKTQDGRVNNLRNARSGEAILLWGPQRIGKTSLIKRFTNNLSVDFIPVYMDVSGNAGGTVELFLYEFALELERQARQRGNAGLVNPQRPQPLSLDDFRMSSSGY